MKPQSSIFKSSLTGKAAFGLRVAVLLSVPQAALAQSQAFGDWEGVDSIEVYVDASALTGDGSFNLPYGSITEALQDLDQTGALGAVDVTLNLFPTDDYSVQNGETFPIDLPAHGVTIETHYAVGGMAARITNGGTTQPGVSSLLRVDAVGNEALSPSVMRGLELENMWGTAAPTAAIRVDPLSSDVPGRIAPEIRDCRIGGEPNIGVDIIGVANVLNETVLDHNDIIQSDPSLGNTVGVRIDGTDGIAMAPLLRSNRVEEFRTNVDVFGGADLNQTRLQSNVIVEGDAGVTVDDAAPWLSSNTIVDARVAGLSWSNTVTELGFTHNLLWNPQAPDVVGNMGIFNNQPAERMELWNFSEDGGLLVNQIFGNTPSNITNPDFVNAGAGDYRLADTSPLRDVGEAAFVVAPALEAALTSTISTAIGDVSIRRDVAYDRDGLSRVQVFQPDIGAYELGAGGVLDATKGLAGSTASGVNPIDAFGNLMPDANGAWNTSVTVTGPPGTIYAVYGALAFDDETMSSERVDVENRALYQNEFYEIPSAGTSSRFTSGLSSAPGDSMLLATGMLGAAGPSGLASQDVALTLGAYNPDFEEGEVYVQALMLANGQMGTSRRLVIELNQ